MLNLVDITIQKKKANLLEECSFVFKENTSYWLKSNLGADRLDIFEVLTGITQPDIGDVIFNDKSLFTYYDQVEAKQRLGVLCQNPVVILNLNIYLNIKTVSNLKGVPESTYIKLLSEYHLEEFLTARPNEMSYRQLQILNFILSTTHNPNLVVWDDISFIESTFEKDKIYQKISELEKNGCTFIYFSEERPDFASNLVELELKQGRFSA